VRVNPGLDGVIVNNTDISLIDGEQGRLVIRGYEIGSFVHDKSFEEMVYLLWKERWPNDQERKRFTESLAEKMVLSETEKNVLAAIPRQIETISAIQAVLSLIPAEWPPNEEDAIQVLAKVPAVVAAHYRLKMGQPILDPDPELGYAEQLIYLLHGKRPNQVQIQALNTYLILTAEHGFNASTFTARVVASTESDLCAAVVAALSALKGRIHGGAPSQVENMLQEIGEISKAEAWLSHQLASGKKLMGFGHRVYRTMDPRAKALKEVVQRFQGNEPWFRLALDVERLALKLLSQHKPGRAISTNVEFYTAAILKAVGIPKEIYTPVFACSRTAGWIAHVLEQSKNNRIIRPDARYTGPIHHRII